MANTSSAKKMVRKISKRTAINRMRKSQMSSAVRRVEEALAAGNRKAAEEAFRLVEPQLMKAAQKNLIHKKTASRKVARLSRRLRTLSA